MSSYLEKSRAAFGNTAKAAAPKLNQRTLAAPPVSAPSPAPSNTSTTSQSENKELKRKREPAKEVFSQPAATGFGSDPFTQVTYVIEFLKKKAEPKTFAEILSYLSLRGDRDSQSTIVNILKRHDRVEYTRDPKSKAWDSGTFAHKPIINVRSKEDLIRYLQVKPDAQGVSVKDLKDGWPDCEGPITELEHQHKVLVTRTKKDNHARMVWGDHPSLHFSIDVEFHALWRKVELPSIDDTVRKLLENGQKPASEDPSKRVKAAAKPKEKKKKAPRKGGRTTNTHMASLLKDYSHMKR